MVLHYHENLNEVFMESMFQRLDIRRQLIALTFPIFIETLLIMLAGFVDIFMLSRVSDHAVAAVGLANQVLMLVYMVFMIGVMGVTVVCSQYIGAKDERGFVKTISAAVAYNIFVGIVTGIFFTFFTPELIVFLDTRAELVDNAAVYFEIAGGFSILVCMNMTYSGIMRSCNLARYPMYVSVVANILNIFGNYVLIFGKFGFPELGVQGAAISTVFSRFVACSLLFYAIKRQKVRDSIFRNMFPFPMDKLRKIMKIGLPGAGEMFSYSLSQTVIVYLVNKLGTEALAARTYLVNIITFIFLFSLSLGQASAIIVGQLAGRKRKDAALKLGSFSLKIAVSVSVILSFCLALSGGRVIPLLTDNANIIALCSAILWIDVVLEVGRAVNILGGRMLSAVGNPEFAFVVGVIIMWGVATFGAYAFGLYLGYGLVGMWICFAADECLRAIFIWRHWTSQKWAKKSLIHAD